LAAGEDIFDHESHELHEWEPFEIEDGFDSSDGPLYQGSYTVLFIRDIRVIRGSIVLFFSDPAQG
jgi:hypothetical protein